MKVWDVLRAKGARLGGTTHQSTADECPHPLMTSAVKWTERKSESGPYSKERVSKSDARQTWGDVLLRPDEGVGAKVGDAHLGVDQRRSVGSNVLDPCWRAARFGLLGEVKVREHDVASMMKKDVCSFEVEVSTVRAWPASRRGGRDVLSGLRSRYMNPIRCRYSRAATTSAA